MAEQEKDNTTLVFVICTALAIGGVLLLKSLNIRETYEWGVQELQRINDRMWVAAKKLYPDAATLREVADRLEKDPRYIVEGEDELIRRLKEFIEIAVERLDGKEFDIDPRIRNCDARLAPEGSASAAYYMGPSEDLSRPGTTWFPTMGRKNFRLVAYRFNLVPRSCSWTSLTNRNIDGERRSLKSIPTQSRLCIWLLRRLGTLCRAIDG